MKPMIFRSTSTVAGAPGYRERSGDAVTIVRPLTAGECDVDEVGQMYRIRFTDGVEADAFANELSDCVR